jgi:hypothetical protein
MHIYISQCVQKDLNLSDKFLAGSILPDMIKLKTLDREATHYIKSIRGTNKRLPDLKKFLKENRDKLDDEIMLGYYAHLIEDKIWFDIYIDSFAKCIDKENILYTKDNTLHSQQEFRRDMYADYVNVDRYIIEKNNMNIDEIRMDIKRQLGKYKLDNIIDENVVFPRSSGNERIRFISQSCLCDYLNQAINEVKKEIKKIIGE